MAGLAVKPVIREDLPAENAPDSPVIAGVGEGAKTAVNPLAGLIGSALPAVSQEDYDTAGTQDVSGVPAGATGDLIATAKKYIGTPYKWGASSPLGFDCSGFTQFVFKQAGVNLPRMSNQQGFGGTAVKSMADAKAGDLIFFDNSPRNNGADHVGIYLGGGQMISAPKPGDVVKIQKVYGSPFFRRYL